ncbi:hypothetical protein F4821DRAFT_237505, partial [Hypoxylon rubiginosum]
MARIRGLHEMLSPLVRRALAGPSDADAVKPLRHAINTSDLGLLSSIDHIIRTEAIERETKNQPQDPPYRVFVERRPESCWDWLLKYKESESCKEFVLLKAMRYSSECFKFLLDIIVRHNLKVVDQRNEVRIGCFAKYARPADERFRISFRELLATAIWHDQIDIVEMILDRPPLFDHSFHWGRFMHSHGLVAQIPSVAMAECVLRLGWKPYADVLHEIVVDDKLYKENRADLLEVITKRRDIDINYGYWRIPLISACNVVNIPAIEALLKLGADPNVVNKSDREERAIEILLTANKWRQGNWRRVSRAMYKAIKLLIEHGATTSPRPRAWNLVDMVLRRIWRLICPVIRHAAGVGPEGKVTLERLLDVLLTVDIRPLDKLCDVVLDSSTQHSDITEGLRGKERLAKILPHIPAIRGYTNMKKCDLKRQAATFFPDRPKRYPTNYKNWQTREIMTRWEEYKPEYNKIAWNEDKDDWEGFDDTCHYDSDLDYYKPLEDYKDYEGIMSYLSYHVRPARRGYHIAINPSIWEMFPET